MVDPIHSSEMAEQDPDDTDVGTILERVERCTKDVSRGFDRWDDPTARGPGLYLVVERESIADHTDPMGSNRWPVEDCGSVLDKTDVLLETAGTVASSCDGAIVVHSDGTIEEAMVRVKQLSSAERRRVGDLPYAEWMGARHMSALETSTREEVVAAITLSEEDGRVTVFANGRFEERRAAAPE